MAKNDPTHPTDTAPARTRTTAPSSRERQRMRTVEEMPSFDTELEERKWKREQEVLERRRAEAWEKYPPGSKLFASTARGIPQRGRAGVRFSDKGRTEVEVVDVTADELAAIRAGNDTILGSVDRDGVKSPDPIAVRIRSGAAIVGPEGAKEIADDDGLQVWTEPANQEATDAKTAELLDENEVLRKQLADARAELAKSKKADRQATNPAAPTRLGDTKPGPGDFGGDDGKSK